MIILQLVLIGLITALCSTQALSLNSETPSSISKPVDLITLSAHVKNVPLQGTTSDEKVTALTTSLHRRRRRPQGWCETCSKHERCSNIRLSCISGHCVKKLKQVKHCNDTSEDNDGDDDNENSPPLLLSKLFGWCKACGEGIGKCHKGLTCVLNHCIKPNPDNNTPCSPGHYCEPRGIQQCLGGRHCATCDSDKIPCAHGHSCIKKRCVLQGLHRKSCDRPKALLCEPCNAERKCVEKVCRERRRRRRRQCRRVQCSFGFCAFNERMAKRRCRRNIQKGGRDVCARRRRRGRRNRDGQGSSEREAKRFEDDVMAAVDMDEMEEDLESDDIQWMSTHSSLGEVDEVDEDKEEEEEDDDDKDEQDDIYIELDE